MARRFPWRRPPGVEDHGAARRSGPAVPHRGVARVDSSGPPRLAREWAVPRLPCSLAAFTFVPVIVPLAPWSVSASAKKSFWGLSSSLQVSVNGPAPLSRSAAAMSIRLAGVCVEPSSARRAHVLGDLVERLEVVARRRRRGTDGCRPVGVSKRTVSSSAGVHVYQTEYRSPHVGVLGFVRLEAGSVGRPCNGACRPAEDLALGEVVVRGRRSEAHVSSTFPFQSRSRSTVIRYVLPRRAE